MFLLADSGETIDAPDALDSSARLRLERPLLLQRLRALISAHAVAPAFVAAELFSVGVAQSDECEAILREIEYPSAGFASAVSALADLHRQSDRSLVGLLD